MAFEKVKEIIKDPPAYTLLTDLAAERLGGKVLFATDDFFAEKENLIKPGREYLLRINIQIAANGWMVGKAVANVHQAMIGL